MDSRREETSGAIDSVMQVTLLLPDVATADDPELTLCQVPKPLALLLTRLVGSRKPVRHHDVVVGFKTRHCHKAKPLVQAMGNQVVFVHL